MQTTITKFYVNKSEKKTITKTKADWITTHTARRTFVTLAIEIGTAQHYVMKWSNHSDPRSFRKYQNSLQGEDLAVQQFLNGLKQF